MTLAERYEQRNLCLAILQAYKAKQISRLPSWMTWQVACGLKRAPRSVSVIGKWYEDFTLVGVN